MNKKGQLGVLGVIFSLFIFFLFWAMAGGKLLKEYGEQAIEEYGYTGIIAFILANMNLWVLIGVILGITVWIGVLSR